MRLLRKIALLTALLLGTLSLFVAAPAHAATTLHAGDSVKLNLYDTVRACIFPPDPPVGAVEGTTRLKLTGPNAQGLSTVTARTSVRLPVGNYYVSIADVGLDPNTGAGLGCSYLPSTFTVNNSHKVTHVSVSMPYDTSISHTLQVFITPQGESPDEAILATKPFLIAPSV